MIKFEITEREAKDHPEFCDAGIMFCIELVTMGVAADGARIQRRLAIGCFGSLESAEKFLLGSVADRFEVQKIPLPKPIVLYDDGKDSSVRAYLENQTVYGE